MGLIISAAAVMSSIIVFQPLGDKDTRRKRKGRIRTGLMIRPYHASMSWLGWASLAILVVILYVALRGDDE